MSSLTPNALCDAAKLMQQRSNTWASNALLDMAAKLGKYGKFASDKQAAFAAKLVAEANAPVAPKPAPTEIHMPRTADLLQPKGKFARLQLQGILIAVKPDAGFAWIIWNEKVAGKLFSLSGMASVWNTDTALHVALATFEAEPLEQAKAYGRATGVCCCCGRTLTNPDSIAAGIGPICAGGF